MDSLRPSLLVAAITLLAACSKPVEEFKNSSGEEQSKGNIKSVKIGNTQWMAENLNVSTYQNGEAIPEAKTDQEWNDFGEKGTGAFCYLKFDAANGGKYGKLYNWFAVTDARGLAPKGWKVPTDSVWLKMIDLAGGKDNAGNALKYQGDWKQPKAGGNGGGENTTGFNALGGSNKDEHEGFMNAGVNGFWWTSVGLGEITPGLPSQMAYASNMYHGHMGCQMFNYWKKNGLSVRCVK